MPFLSLHLQCRESRATLVLASCRSFALAHTKQNCDSDWQMLPNNLPDVLLAYACCASQKNLNTLCPHAKFQLVCQAILPAMYLHLPVSTLILLFLHRLLS